MGAYHDGEMLGCLEIIETMPHNRYRCFCHKCYFDKLILPEAKLHGFADGRDSRCPMCKYSKVGKRFGRLLAVGFHSRQDDQVFFLCKCDCGSETIVPRSALIKGKISSCGCGSRQEAKTKTVSRVFYDPMCKARPNNSGVRGVFKRKSGWMGFIIFQSKFYYLGTFKTCDEAKAKRMEAERVRLSCFDKICQGISVDFEAEIKDLVVRSREVKKKSLTQSN